MWYAKVNVRPTTPIPAYQHESMRSVYKRLNKHFYHDHVKV